MCTSLSEEGAHKVADIPTSVVHDGHGDDEHEGDDDGGDDDDDDDDDDGDDEDDGYGYG